MMCRGVCLRARRCVLKTHWICLAGMADDVQRNPRAPSLLRLSVRASKGRPKSKSCAMPSVRDVEYGVDLGIAFVDPTAVVTHSCSCIRRHVLAAAVRLFKLLGEPYPVFKYVMPTPPSVTTSVTSRCAYCLPITTAWDWQLQALWSKPQAHPRFRPCLPMLTPVAAHLPDSRL